MRFFKSALLSLATIFFSIAANASISCSNFLEFGNPSSKATIPLAQANQYLCRDGYVVGYNFKTKQPTWAAYHLTGESVSKKLKRHDDFRPDPAVSIKHQSQLSDYRRSGYDRGHLAPYAAMDFSAKSASESFLLSNMSPQRAGLNRKGWERLEENVRSWAKTYKSIWVVDGPIFKNKAIHKTIGRSKVAVPDAFFKVVYAPEKIRGPKTIAFIMPNANVSKKGISKYIVPINEVEDRTGLTFLTNVPATNRTAMLNEKSPMWPTHFRHSKRKP